MICLIPIGQPRHAGLTCKTRELPDFEIAVGEDDLDCLFPRTARIEAGTGTLHRGASAQGTFPGIVPVQSEIASTQSSAP
jgi:hypothetical protein